eukprot:TRINITY_DN38190_c0_g1_i1.p1 TRINITY_DN38190_c0_g1~~TRINITY_DN38190_c0_g1_i1.p1  ORF type:complete len:445 (+),score=3.25 TRINITY_DN38190_c0_g1_i1:104-1438(+)
MRAPNESAPQVDEITEAMTKVPWVRKLQREMIASGFVEIDLWRDTPSARQFYGDHFAFWDLVRHDSSPWRSWTDDGSVNKRSCHIYMRQWFAHRRPLARREMRDVSAQQLSSVVSVGYFRPGCFGPLKTVHSGAIASMLDALLGNLCYVNGTGGPTLSMSADYHQPLIASDDGGAIVLLEARITRVESGSTGKGCKVYGEARMHDGKGDKKPSTLIAFASGIWFHRTNTVNAEPLTPGPAWTVPLEPFQRQLSDTDSQPLRIPMFVSFDSGGPCTQTASRLLSEGWILHPKILGYDGSNFFGSERVAFDSLWQPETLQFRVCFALSRHCMGPPGSVHGGCHFLVHDIAASMCCHLHIKNHEYLQGQIYSASSVSLDFKSYAPLDQEFVVDVSMDRQRCWDSSQHCVSFFSTFASADDVGRVHSVGYSTLWRSKSIWHARRASAL